MASTDGQKLESLRRCHFILPEDLFQDFRRAAEANYSNVSVELRKVMRSYVDAHGEQNKRPA